MDKFITLTSLYDGKPIVVRVNSIAYMRSIEKNNTLIRFLCTFSTQYESRMFELKVKESLEEVQSKMYL